MLKHYYQIVTDEACSVILAMSYSTQRLESQAHREANVKTKLLAWCKSIVSVCIGALAVTAFEGIIGNRADTLFTLVWPSIEEIVHTNLVCCCLLLACIGICVYFRQRSQMLEQAFATDHKMLNLDDSLFRGLASWVPSQNTEQENKRIITDLLLDATAEFDGQVQRAALLLPDASREYLYCWANYQMPQESVDHMKFYIGPDKSRRQRESGVAGEAFLTGELQVGHLRRANGDTWISEDCPSYIKFPGRRPFSPYRSFVNVPIIGVEPNTPNSSHATCLGVICFDSMDQDVFDSKERQVVLRTFARRITAALLIFQIYQNQATPLAHSNSIP